MRRKASVAIIGGGIIGASLAYNLASKGVDGVVVLEKSKVGSGTTAASLGGFRSQFSNALSVTLSQMSMKVIERFEELTGYDPLVSRDGYVFVVSEEASYERLKKDGELQRGMGVPVEFVEKEELQRRFPFYDFGETIGGNLCMEDGHASTGAVLQGFMTSSKRMGVEVSEDTEVRSVEGKPGGGFEVKTSTGALESEAVVIASGAYSGLVGKLASVKIPIEPYPRKVLITKPFTDGIPERIPLIIDVDSTFAFGREGRGLLFGTNPPSSPAFDSTFPPDYEDEVMRMAIERVPAAAHSSINRSVAGLYEMSPDANPIVGELPGKPGLYCCAGFAGHGFMHAPAIGELFAELFTRGKTTVDISSFRIERFATGAGKREGRIV